MDFVCISLKKNVAPPNLHSWGELKPLQLNGLNLNKAWKLKKKKTNTGDREDSEHYLGEEAKGLSGLKQFNINAKQPLRPDIKFWKWNCIAAPTVSQCPPCFHAHPSWAPGQGSSCWSWSLMWILSWESRHPAWEQESSPDPQGRAVQGSVILWAHTTDLSDKTQLRSQQVTDLNK